MLFSLTAMLCVNLTGAIDHLMDEARVPDYLQMHTGDIDPDAIEEFAGNNPNVRKWQISSFLNLENGSLYLGNHNMADSTQDNGLCIQNRNFDFLLDEEGNLPVVHQGQVYVPVCYRQQYGLEPGDWLVTGKVRLVIAGFIRDAQMNSMMASSKRFLVCEQDYERIKGQGTEEYLIEFLLADGVGAGAFATSYAQAGLASNGPAVTRSLMRMMNTLSDGILILVILVVSILVFLISAVCIRFILLIRIEKEKGEIGMLKALGVGKKEVQRIYFSKYAFFACAGALPGLALSRAIYPSMTVKVQELYGVSAHKWQNTVFPIASAICVMGCILLFINRMIRKIEKISALDVFLERTGGKRKYGQRRYIAIISAVCVFLMIIPANLYSTLSSRDFVTYMGIGDGEIRIDIRPGTHMNEVTDALVEKLNADSGVSRISLLQTQMMTVITDMGKENLLVETGDHTIFPVSYCQGRAPQGNDDIALSVLEAQELTKTVGDTITIEIDRKSQTYHVCGIYSDITNGGKTAKINAFEEKAVNGEIMWNILYIALQPNADHGKFITSYRNWLQKTDEPVKIVDIHDYVMATYGQTLEQIRLASILTDAIAICILLVVTILFLKLLIARERHRISLKKALGLGNRDIIRKYFITGTGCAVGGIAAGVMIGSLLGEKLCGAILVSFGVMGFRFIYDWTGVLFETPLAVLLTVMFAVWIAVRDIYGIKASECCRERKI